MVDQIGEFLEVSLETEYHIFRRDRVIGVKTEYMAMRYYPIAVVEGIGDVMLEAGVDSRSQVEAYIQHFVMTYLAEDGDV